MATTLAQLRTLVRMRTNTEQSQFVTDAELTLYLNQELGELDDLLVSTYDDYKLSTEASTVAAGAQQIELPEDFYKLRGVDKVVGSRNATLRPYTFLERNKFSPGGISVGGIVPVQYKVTGNFLELIPKENAPGSYLVHYVPKFVDLEADDDELPVYMDTQAWSAFAVAGAAAKVQQKQDLDAGIYVAEKAQQQYRILTAAKPRDAGHPKKVVDTRGMRLRRGLCSEDDDDGWWG